MTPAPLVILSAPHSEAARLAAALGNHPMAVALPELHLLHSRHVADLLQIFERSTGSTPDGLLRCIAHLHGEGDSDTGIAEARAWLQRRAEWTTTGLLTELVAAFAPKRVVLFDTSAALRITDLDRYFEALPWAGFLHLQRHPQHFIRSTHAQVDGRLDIPPDYKDHAQRYPRLEPQLMWYRVHRTLSEELARRAAEGMRCRAQRLEDVFAAPGVQLAAICAWMGWANESDIIAQLLQPPKGPFCRPGPPVAPGGFELTDPAQPFVSPLAERSSEAGLDGLAREASGLARDFGYR